MSKWHFLTFIVNSCIHELLFFFFGGGVDPQKCISFLIGIIKSAFLRLCVYTWAFCIGWWRYKASTTQKGGGVPFRQQAGSPTGDPLLQPQRVRGRGRCRRRSAAFFHSRVSCAAPPAPAPKPEPLSPVSQRASLQRCRHRRRGERRSPLSHTPP